MVFISLNNFHLLYKNIPKKTINRILIIINHANRFLNTEDKFVADDTPIPAFPSIAFDHSLRYTPNPPIKVNKIMTSNIFVEKKLTNRFNVSNIHANVSLNHINDKKGEFGLHGSSVKSGDAVSNESEIPAYILNILNPS